MLLIERTYQAYTSQIPIELICLVHELNHAALEELFCSGTFSTITQRQLTYVQRNIFNLKIKSQLLTPQC